MKSLKPLLLALSPLFSFTTALGQNATVTTANSAPGLLQLAGNGVEGQILLSANDWWGVIRAAEDLAIDFGKVTGKNLTLGHWGPGTNSTNSTVSKRQFYRPGGPPPWGRDGPSSGGHNGSVTNGSGATVFYTYNPVTSFVNVSSYNPKLINHQNV